MQERMTGFRCRGCSRLHYPRHVRCLSCRGTDFEEVDLGNECTLLTWTKLYVLPGGIEMSPLLLGIVEFPNGVRALGQLAGDDIKAGQRLRPGWGKLRTLGGKDVYGFRFEPERQRQ